MTERERTVSALSFMKFCRISECSNAPKKRKKEGTKCKMTEGKKGKSKKTKRKSLHNQQVTNKQTRTASKTNKVQTKKCAASFATNTAGIWREKVTRAGERKNNGNHTLTVLTCAPHGSFLFHAVRRHERGWLLFTQRYKWHSQRARSLHQPPVDLNWLSLAFGCCLFIRKMRIASICSCLTEANKARRKSIASVVAALEAIEHESHSCMREHMCANGW